MADPLLLIVQGVSRGCCRTRLVVLDNQIRLRPCLVVNVDVLGLCLVGPIDEGAFPRGLKRLLRESDLARTHSLSG